MKHKISKTAFWLKTGEPKRYANPKQINGKTIFLHFSSVLKIDSDKLTIFKDIYALIIRKYSIR